MTANLILKVYLEIVKKYGDDRPVKSNIESWRGTMYKVTNLTDTEIRKIGDTIHSVLSVIPEGV